MMSHQSTQIQRYSVEAGGELIPEGPRCLKYLPELVYEKETP